MKRVFLVLLFLSGICHADIKGNIVSWWKLNDNAATTTVVDSVGSNDGTFVDATGDPCTNAHDTNGRVNGALIFDGTDDAIDSDSAFQLTYKASFSISIWIKPDDGQPAAEDVIFGSTQAFHAVYIIVQTTGSLEFHYKASNNATSYTTGSPDLLTNGQETWHHVVAVADSTMAGVGGLTIYLNGDITTADSTGDTTGITFAGWNSSVDSFIGSLGSTPTDFFAGDIDNVSIFSVALTADEVKYLYNGGRGLEVLGQRSKRGRYSGNPYRTRYSIN